eukprot:53427-Pyramimonas_sp.AAC.1
MAVTWWTPTCSPWPQASRGDAEKREAEREAQHPTLAWCISDIQAGQRRNEHAVVENPNASNILDKPDLALLSGLGLRQH